MSVDEKYSRRVAKREAFETLATFLFSIGMVAFLLICVASLG